MPTIATDSQTHTHTHTYTHIHIHTETDKPLAIGEILQIFLNISNA